MAIKDRLEKAKIRLDEYYKAELAILSGQQYKIGTRSLQRADLSEVRSAIKELENQCLELEYQLKNNSRRRSMRIVPRDF